MAVENLILGKFNRGISIGKRTKADKNSAFPKPKKSDLGDALFTYLIQF